MAIINITKRVQIEGKGWRFCEVPVAANGKLKPNVVLVDGVEQVHSEGQYYLDYTNGKRCRVKAGRTAAEAMSAAERQAAILNGAKHGLVAATNDTAAAPVRTNTTPLAEAVKEYLREVQAHKHAKTHASYKVALDYFLASCPASTLGEVTRGHLMDFAVYLRTKKNQSPRSVSNKFLYVVSFLKQQGIVGLTKKNDAPKYVEENVEIYEREEHITPLFAACTEEERLWFKFFLMTGFREQEVMFCTWADVNLSAGVVKVTAKTITAMPNGHKKDYVFVPKKGKEREVPICTELVTLLTAHKAKSSGCRLVFSTEGCCPKFDFLDCLKSVATRAGLNPADFWLHRFRATFATWSLWAGVDLKTVQTWLGHSDMESTMRYLKAKPNAAVREKVNAIFA